MRHGSMMSHAAPVDKHARGRDAASVGQAATVHAPAEWACWAGLMNHRVNLGPRRNRNATRAEVLAISLTPRPPRVADLPAPGALGLRSSDACLQLDPNVQPGPSSGGRIRAPCLLRYVAIAAPALRRSSRVTYRDAAPRGGNARETAEKSALLGTSRRSMLFAKTIASG